MTGVRLSPSIVRALDQAAADAGVTRSELIRRWLQDRLGGDVLKGRSEYFRFGYWAHPKTEGVFYIAVDGWARLDADKEGRPILSPDLATEQEVDETIDGLIRDLEATRKLTKAAVRRYRDKLVQRRRRPAIDRESK